LLQETILHALQDCDMTSLAVLVLILPREVYDGEPVDIRVWRRPEEVVRRSIEHSLCFGIYDGAGLAALVRVVTD